MKKIQHVLLTGNKGYIGSVLTQLLLEKNYDVTGFDTDYYSGCDFFKEQLPIKQIHKDIRNISASDLIGIDAIIHLAGLSNDPLSEFNPKLTFDINYIASVRLAELAKKSKIARFIFASSQSIYGIAGNEFITEKSRLNPITTYAKSKILVEQDVAKLADKTFTPVYLRPSTVYGISPRLRLDIVLNNLTAWAVTTGTINILSDGSPWRPVVHVEDVSRAFIAALEAPVELVFNEAFNVGETENFRVKEMAELIKEQLPESTIVFSSNANPDERTYKVNSDKIRTVLKDYFAPTWNIKKGITQLRTAFKKHTLSLKEFQGDKFIRLNHLKKLLKQNKIDAELYWNV